MVQARAPEIAFAWLAGSIPGSALAQPCASMQDLGVLPGGTYSSAQGASSDGSVVVGHGGSSSGNRAFRWVACPPCSADLDDGSGTGVPDGAVTIEDLLFFLTDYEAGC